MPNSVNGHDDDMFSTLMGFGDDPAERLIRQVQADTLRAMNEEWCRKIVHGEHPCDCGTAVCVGVRLFA